MAKLFFKYGTMKSGKSTHLLMTAHNYNSQGKNVMLYTSRLDTRWGNSKIRSRIGIQKEAIKVSDNIVEEVRVENERFKVSCVLVDEVQFLTKENIIDLSRIVDDLDIPVICYGLKNDFQNNLFEGSKALLEFADDIELIKTVCQHKECNKKATMNLRLHDGEPIYHGEQIMVGDIEYVPVCRKHYNYYK